MYTVSRQGKVDVVRGDDPLKLDVIAAVQNVFVEVTANHQPHVVLDMAEMPLIDSAGLELLLDVRDVCLRRGGELKLASPNPLCRDILQMTGVAEKFAIFGDTLSAVGSFVR